MGLLSKRVKPARGTLGSVQNPSQGFFRRQGTPVSSGGISDLFQKIQDLKNKTSLTPMPFYTAAENGPATMANSFSGASPLAIKKNFDQSQIERIREMIRQQQQQMAQPASQQPQMDPAAIQARLDAFLANNPDRTSVSLPFGGSIDLANLRDRMAQMSTLMGQEMTAQPMQNFDFDVRPPPPMISDNTRMNAPVMGPVGMGGI